MIAAKFAGINQIVFHLLSSDDVKQYKIAKKLYNEIIPAKNFNF